MEYVTLNNGLRFPALSLGTYAIKDVEQAVVNAIYAGYRAFDTAAFYENESGLARGITASGEPREELLVTSKIWYDHLDYDQALASFDESERKLGRIDIMLIHWPRGDAFLPAWKALERIYEEKRVKAIGVANFKVHHLKTLTNHSNVKPAINQVEAQLGYFDADAWRYCRENDIQLCAWSPLRRGHGLRAEDDALLAALAAQYGKSPAQIALRYLWQKGFCVLPKASTTAHLQENTNIFDFALEEESLRQLEKLQHSSERLGEDPDTNGLLP